MDLHDISDDDLMADVVELVGSYRKITATLVVHLAEIEERRLHLLAGFSSMFEFCTKRLGLSEGEAFRRIAAARLAQRYPRVYSMLASGAVNLSTLVLIRELLTDENCDELFAAVDGKSKMEVQEYLALRFPRPDRPSRIRRDALEPLSASRFAVEFTASSELREKLELARDLMSHVNPSRDLGFVIERAMDLLLVDLERKRLARTQRPRRTSRAASEGTFAGKSTGMSKPRAGGREAARVAKATRREVFQRDGVRCSFVSEDGRRCESRALLELDHVQPRALGGTHDARNLRVRCRAHNQLWAEQAFGRETVERGRHFRQRKSGMGSCESSVDSCRKKSSLPSSEHVVATEGAPQPLPLEKVRLALRRLGFPESVTRHAIDVVATMHSPNEALSLEQVFREAVTVAAAA